eukprot:6459172-Amphidinium_carterae.1
MVESESAKEYRTRHISIKGCRLEEDIKRGVLAVRYTNTKLQMADGLTKQLMGDSFEHAVKAWGLVPLM